ncbi:hypothetical protein [Paraburkholderia sp. 32]|uniref:hypothetical protein n=1 Tax=Paraburkholderia sp. 32 TaxID=2991057 RepID=UPI003D19DD99
MKQAKTDSKEPNSVLSHVGFTFSDSAWIGRPSAEAMGAFDGKPVKLSSRSNHLHNHGGVPAAVSCDEARHAAAHFITNLSRCRPIFCHRRRLSIGT